MIGPTRRCGDCSEESLPTHTEAQRCLLFYIALSFSKILFFLSHDPLFPHVAVVPATNLSDQKRVLARGGGVGAVLTVCHHTTRQLHYHGEVEEDRKPPTRRSIPLAKQRRNAPRKRVLGEHEPYVRPRDTPATTTTPPGSSEELKGPFLK